MSRKKPFKNSLLKSIFFFALALVLAGNVVVAESAEVGSVTAIVIDEEVRVGDENADEGEIRWPSRFPEHPEMYMPMPLPEPTEPVEVIQPESRVVSYDMSTGEEFIWQSIYEDVPMDGWVDGESRTGAGRSGDNRFRPQLQVRSRKIRA